MSINEPSIFPIGTDDAQGHALLEAVIGAAYEVANTLGAGFLEKLYERALAGELTLRGIQVQPQVSFPISYKGKVVGEYVADLLVEHSLIVEVKCVDRFGPSIWLSASAIFTLPA